MVNFFLSRNRCGFIFFVSHLGERHAVEEDETSADLNGSQEHQVRIPLPDSRPLNRSRIVNRKMYIYIFCEQKKREKKKRGENLLPMEIDRRIHRESFEKRDISGSSGCVQDDPGNRTINYASRERHR